MARKKAVKPLGKIEGSGDISPQSQAAQGELTARGTLEPGEEGGSGWQPGLVELEFQDQLGVTEKPLLLGSPEANAKSDSKSASGVGAVSSVTHSKR